MFMCRDAKLKSVGFSYKLVGCISVSSTHLLLNIPSTGPCSSVLSAWMGSDSQDPGTIKPFNQESL